MFNLNLTSEGTDTVGWMGGGYSEEINDIVKGKFSNGKFRGNIQTFVIKSQTLTRAKKSAEAFCEQKFNEMCIPEVSE